MEIIDLRSDTVTKPTQGMLEAMMDARVGDDVFGEDQETIDLERIVAGLFGKEAGLFCPSGTMTNQIAIKLHTQPGDEVLCDRLSHVYNFEGGGIAYHSGCSVRMLHGDRGRFKASDVRENINNSSDVHQPLTRLVVVENTSNKGGGAIWQADEMQKISDTCREYGLKYHLDGARLFNALIETGEQPETFGKMFDTISICLSKGLGAPIGSLLLGSKEDISRARRIRKVMGGGMRQSGYLAAAGIYALKNNKKRMNLDHRNARYLEQVLNQLDYVEQVYPVETNIVIFKLAEEFPAGNFLEKLQAEGVKAVPFGDQTIRMVTHLGIDEKMIARAEEVLKRLG